MYHRRFEGTVERFHDLRIVELSEDKLEVVICGQKPEIIPLGLT
jgi:hypothetical protein